MITTVSKQDIEEINQLLKKVITTCIDAEKGPIAGIINECISNGQWAVDNPGRCAHYVYRDGKKIVGVILIRDFWNMTSLFVLPEYHRKGIATKLVDRALDDCKERSEKGLVRLNSSTYAAGYYEKYGFKSAGNAKPLPGGCIPFEWKF